MSKYAILTTIPGGEEFDGEEYPLATHHGAVKAFRRLQAKSAYYEPQERHRIAKAEGFTDQIEDSGTKGEGPDKQEWWIMKEPELTASDFVEQAAQVLFPTAPVEDNEEQIDRAVFREAESDFLSATGKKDAMLNESSTALASFLTQALGGIDLPITNQDQETPTETT